MEYSDIPVTDSAEIESPAFESGDAKKKRTLFFIILGAVVLVGLLVFATVRLFQADLDTTSRIRDIFIIFMALQSLVLGVALIILIVQLATLINVFKNEIKPILDTTNETLRNLRGTTTFISNNLVEPVIKMNEYTAGLRKFVDLLSPKRKSK